MKTQYRLGKPMTVQERCPQDRRILSFHILRVLSITLSRKSHLKYQLYLIRKANAFVLLSDTLLYFVVYGACTKVQKLGEFV